MRLINTFLAAAALVAVAGCSNPQSAPEPANEATAAAMPETPDLSDTAADERAAGMTAPATGAGTAEPSEGAATPG